MNFSPLREGEASELERLMLDSARDDAPSPRVRARALAALGLSAGITAAASATAHAATGALVGGAGGKAVGSVTTVTLAKWLLAGALAGVATTSGVLVATNPDIIGFGASAKADRTAEPVAALPRSRAARSAVASEAPLLVPSPAPVAGPSEVGASLQPQASHSRVAPGDRAPRADSMAAPTGNAFPLPRTDTVTEEVATLDQSRAALAAGNARAALALMDAYDQKYPRGTLVPEATVLRVRALVQLGRRRDATAVVDRFVAAHPTSPQAVHLRALVGESRL